MATAAAAMAPRMGTTWPMLEITAGWPLNKSFSTSASLVAAKAPRSVLQKRHLMATALMASPHTGQGLVSASMLAPLHLKVYTVRRAEANVRPHFAVGRIVRSSTVLSSRKKDCTARRGVLRYKTTGGSYPC